jgi:hypothetical protein
VVPEPSSSALIAIGAFALIPFIVRRPLAGKCTKAENMTRNAKHMLSLLVALATLAATTAKASPITLSISGVVEAASDGSELISPTITAGMPFTAVVVYDLEVPDIYFDNPNQGRFAHPPGYSSISIKVNGLLFQSSGSEPADVQVWNELPIGFSIGGIPPPLGDAFSMVWTGLTAPIPFDGISTSFQLIDHTAKAFASDQLPTALDPAAFDQLEIVILGIRHLPQPGLRTLTRLNLRVDSISVVPEPSTIGLAGMACMSLVALAMWRRLQSPARAGQPAANDQKRVNAC